jgi:membrane peptidoglycan carboxypeptidase
VTFGVAKLSLAIAVSGLLVTGLMLPFVGGAGIATRNSLKSFEDQPCDVNLTTPAEKSTIYASDSKTPIATLFAYNRVITPMKALPDVVKKATVAIEDRRFYEHHGVDVQGLARAMIRNSTSGSTQGGSTLTQQLVKQTRLYDAKTPEEQAKAIEQTPARKLSEAKCALTLEKKYSKDEILWRYLNIANFGAGAYGVGTAAQTYFSKPLNKLSIAQAAMLAGMVQSPSRTNPYNNPKAAIARRNVVLDEMESLNYLTARQATAAKAEPLGITKKKSTAQGCANANRQIVNAGFFCQYLLTWLANNGFPQSRLEIGGFKIYTTLDKNLQNAAQAAAFDKLSPTLRATAVMDLIDPTNGRVRALAVSKHYGNNTRDKTQTTISLPTIPVAGAGSTYKLFTLISALHNKIPLHDFNINAGNSYSVSDNCKTPGREDKPVRNAGQYPDRPYDLQNAMSASVNTFFVALIDQQFGCDLTLPVDYALRLGMNTLKTKKANGEDRSLADATKAEKRYSFTLGPDGTSPLELAGAYGAIANHGKYCPPIPVDKIVDANNKPVGLPAHECTQAVEPGIADTITHVLADDTIPGADGTANQKFASYYSAGGSIVGGKTGTASSSAPGDEGKNSAAWFVGVTPRFAASVAVFNPDNPATALRDVPGFDGGGGDVFGAFGAGIYLEALSGVLLNGPKWQWPAEDPAVVAGNSVPVPQVVGLDLKTAKDRLAAAGFDMQESHEKVDSPLPPDRIAEQSPNGRAMQGSTIVVKLSSGKGKPGQQPGGGVPCLPILPQCRNQGGPPPPGGGHGGGGGNQGPGGTVGPTPPGNR